MQGYLEGQPLLTCHMMNLLSNTFAFALDPNQELMAFQTNDMVILVFVSVWLRRISCGL